MSTELDLDLAAMVGETEDLECEHTMHTGHPLHGGEATHYVRGRHCGTATDAYAACGTMVAFIRSGQRFICTECDEVATGAEAFEILGPVMS